MSRVPLISKLYPGRDPKTKRQQSKFVTHSQLLRDYLKRPIRYKTNPDRQSYMNLNQTFKPLLGSPVSYDLFGDMANTSGGRGLDATPPTLSLPLPSVSTSSSSAANASPGERKKQERAIKNRQSAQASRERKRQYMDELEQERETLLTESRNLRARVSTLETEKGFLLGELSTLKRDFEQLKQLVLGGKRANAAKDESVSENCPSTAFGIADTPAAVPSVGPPGTTGQHYHCVSEPVSVKHGSRMDEKGTVTGVPSLALGSGIMSAHNLVAGLGLSATQWVWRGLSSESLVAATPQSSSTSPPTHLPSVSPTGSNHLLVSSTGGAGSMHGQASGLNHVMRLRLRYRRSPTTPVTRPSTPTNGNSNHGSRMVRSKLLMLRQQRLNPSATPQYHHRRRSVRRMKSGFVPGKSTLAAPTGRVLKGSQISSSRRRFTPTRDLKIQMRQRMTMIWAQIISGCMEMKKKSQVPKKRFSK